MNFIIATGLASYYLVSKIPAPTNPITWINEKIDNQRENKKQKTFEKQKVEIEKRKVEIRNNLPNATKSGN
jgi:hypothetical protein